MTNDHKNKTDGICRKGFSLAELLIVVVVAGVLVAIAVPNFLRTVERERANQAIMYLRLIRSAQQVHFANNGRFACTNAAGECDTAAEIRAVLGVEVTEDNYTFDVEANAAGNGFTATATNNAGPITIILNEACVWSGSYTPLPAAC